MAAPPPAPLRILHLEDDPNDVILVRDALQQEGIDCSIQNVSTRGEFLSSLEQGTFDLILSDYALPTFDGLSALELSSEKVPDVPFIIVSGTLGEEAAIQALRGGATDYVLKHRLQRLGPAVQRAVNEAEAHRTRLRLEAQLRQAQKLQAIGQLAGGVAHDFNNLLTAILGYCQLGRRRLPDDHPVRQEFDEVEKAADRAATLTAQLLAFSRQQVLQPKVVQLNTVLTDTERMLRRLIGENILLQVRPGEGLWRNMADPGQLEQVIMNLALNARDAMPSGGRLVFSTSNVVLDEDYTRANLEVRPGRYVLLTVSDTGCGIDPETRARIFEPFFTTKEVGRGTGLGLSTVHGIVTQSGGHIEVSSELNRGATFRVYLPAVEAKAEELAPAPGPSVTEGGTETILLVEDEAAVRAVVGEMLRKAGYTVLEASDGEQALGIDERAETPIELIVTDVVMPRMNGVELAKALARRHPGLRALFISGHTDLAVLRHGVLNSELQYLQKPFSLVALLRRVREVLEEPRSRAA